MLNSTTSDGIGRYFEAIQKLQTEVIESQHDLLQQVAEKMAVMIEQDGRIFTFGTGHSFSLAVEGHHRAGGLAAVVPVVSSAFMVHENAAMATLLERTPGLAEPLLARYDPQPHDMLFVFSNSGVNVAPVEMALAGKARRLCVVGVCSMAYARVASVSVAGKRLFEIADFTIDNGGLPGDSLVAVDGVPWHVGPSSTVIGALIWNSLVTETVFRLQSRISSLPVYISSNIPHAAEHNTELLAHWRTRNPHL